MPPLTRGFCALRAAQCDCPLKSRFPIFVPPEGDMDGGGVVIMGEAGGETEGRDGRPFVGRTGKELRGALSQIAVPIDAIHNMAPRALRQHTPSKREVQACWECHVGEWLRSLQPKLIVAVGGVAAGWLADVGVEKFHGSTYPCVQSGLEGTPVFVTYHPSAMVRNRPKYQALFEGDYTALEAYYLGQQHLDRTTYIIDDISNLRGAVESQTRIVVDFETTPIGSEDFHVIGVAVRTPELTGYFHGTPSREDYEALLRPQSVYFNGVGFDLRLFPDDLKYAEVDDVFVMAKILQKPFGSLRDLAAYEFGVQHESIKHLYSRLGGFDNVGEELALKACEDVELTDRLHVQYASELEEAGLWPIYLLERAGAPLVRRTEDLGMMLDHTEAESQLQASAESMAAAELEFQSQAPWRHLTRVVTTTWGHLFAPLLLRWPGHGRPKTIQDWVEPVNPRSPQQIVEMFEKLGVPLTKTTKSGDQFSVDGEVLETIDHPVADALRGYRKVEKRTQFIGTLAAAGDWIRFRLKPLGAISGRFSSGEGEETDQ